MDIDGNVWPGNRALVANTVSAVQIHRMDERGSCSCLSLSPHPSFPPSLFPLTRATGIVSFLHSKSRQSGRTLECCISSSHSSLLSLWFGFLLVEGWISLLADLKSAARQRCWFHRLLCVYSAFIVLSFLLSRTSKPRPR